MRYIKSRYDMACEILNKTDDGNNLSKKDLKIVECAVNNYLNDKGIEYFNNMYKDIVKKDV